jgi:hypothetical protein
MQRTFRLERSYGPFQTGDAEMINLNPELILMHNDEVTVQNLAREYDSWTELHEYYKAKADRVGLTLEAYCKRFGVKLH